MRRLLATEHRPDAVICTNDIVAIGAIDTLSEAGLRKRSAHTGAHRQGQQAKLNGPYSIRGRVIERGRQIQPLRIPCRSRPSRRWHERIRR